MAKDATNMGKPIDEPRITRPGVLYRESDFHGSEKHLALEPEHPERTAKGDIGLSDIKDFPSRPLSHGGLPFVLEGK